MPATAARDVVRRVAALEAGMWRSLYRWLLRRPPAPDPGTEPFGYVGVVKPMLIVFIVVSAVEIPLLDLIISRTVPWRPVRVIALAIGVYGLIWMIGLFAGLRVHPHLVGADGLRVRSGTDVDITLPWEAVAAVRSRYRPLPSSRGVQTEVTGDGLIVNIATGGQTSVDVVFRRPTVVRLPKGPSEPATELRFYADEPDALTARARQHLAA
jgi:hypothetical protein